ncbi:hypothetical protein [Lichenicoccus sp.]|uniref:hypothetical protein n=1 Tax=Lichenicoccus sp. TaxID=2781899 RepID=UPI003D0A2269
MQPRMSTAEIALFEGLLRCSQDYVEFGSGGSTCLASGLVGRSILSVDSAEFWLQQVREACAAAGAPAAGGPAAGGPAAGGPAAGVTVVPELVGVDIGAVGNWGYPVDPTTHARWSAYHSDIWANPRAARADLYLVDGRFRIACAMQVLRRCRPDALLLVHDFASRAHYHPIREVAQEIATVEDLSLFRCPPARDMVQIHALLDAYRFEPA